MCIRDRRDTALTREDALIEIYRRLRPGEPPTVDASRSLLEGLLFNPQRYDLARVGRYKVNKKLNLTTEEEVTVLTDEDIVATLRYLLSLAAGEQGFKVDDIDQMCIRDRRRRRASTWSATTYTTAWFMWMATSALPSVTRSCVSRRSSSRASPSPGP